MVANSSGKLWLYNLWCSDLTQRRTNSFNTTGSGGPTCAAHCSWASRCTLDTWLRASGSSAPWPPASLNGGTWPRVWRGSVSGRGVWEGPCSYHQVSVFASCSLCLSVCAGVEGLCLCPGPGPFPGVLDMWGGGGGLVEYRAALLASHGYVSLALEYLSPEEVSSAREEVQYFEVCPAG